MVVARVKAVGLARVRAEGLVRVLVPKKAERRVSVESEPGVDYNILSPRF
jgi:hypothetical protein